MFRICAVILLKLNLLHNTEFVCEFYLQLPINSYNLIFHSCLCDVTRWRIWTKVYSSKNQQYLSTIFIRIKYNLTEETYIIKHWISSWLPLPKWNPFFYHFSTIYFLTIFFHYLNLHQKCCTESIAFLNHLFYHFHLKPLKHHLKPIETPFFWDS